MGQSSAVVLLHLRRLDRFLRSQGLHSIAHTLESESMAYLDAAHLEKLVRRGRWNAAWCYLRRFPSLLSEEGGDGTSQHYTALMRTLEHHSMLNFLACRGDEGGRDAEWLYCRPDDDAFRSKFPEIAQLHDLYRSMTSAQARASLNWDQIKLTTLEKLHDFLHLHPGLECSLRVRLLQHVPTLSEIAPLSLLGSRRHRKKRVNRKPAHEIAQFLLQKRHPSTEVTSHSDSSGVKRPRCQDDCYTGNPHQAFDPKEGSKRPRTRDVGECSSEKQEEHTDFIRGTVSMKESHVLSSF